MLESNPSKFPHERVYHASSRGLLIDCLITLVDPKGRNVGEFVR